MFSSVIDDISAKLPGHVAKYSRCRLPKDYHFATFQERLPRNGNEAALLLRKAIEFGIVLRREGGEFQGIGIIDLPRYEE